MNKAVAQNTKRIDFIYDSYFEASIKSSERMRRRKSDCIVYNNIAENVSLPKQEETFWASSENKILLQQFLRTYVQEKKLFSGFELVFSTINSDYCTSTSNDSDFLDMLQRNDLEEADLKIIIHSNHAVQQKYRNLYVLSSDTDFIVLLLYFFNHFQNNGLQIKLTS